MRLGVIGAGGYWGEKWVRNLKSLNVLGGICEIDDSNSQMITSKYALTPNNVIINSDVDLFLENRFDGIVIATPPSTHFEIARKALSKNHNILVEKPLVIDPTDGLELESMMIRRGNILMAGHTFVYHPAVRALKEVLNSLGDLQKLNIVRANWGKYQDVGILYDLFPHDLSLVN
ncbi:MAG: Gfo/Idh/MocA family oxidoreductase, partial [Bacteroidetes bacterium]|nr:Gfo/Idh/MocA family oxidoreductase [Bacteroidota bacterium]